jgi:hypothetical protein
VLWCEAYHRRNIVLQRWHSALDSETPPFGLLFAKSGWRPHDNSIISRLVYDPSSLFLGVQSIHLRGCQGGGNGQRSGSGDASSQS